MLCAFCPLTVLGDFYRILEKSPKSSADKMYRACESKDQTCKKIRTLHFPDLGGVWRENLVGRSAQRMKHENAQKFSSKISLNSSPNSSPRISPGHKNLSPQSRSGECQASHVWERWAGKTTMEALEKTETRSGLATTAKLKSSGDSQHLTPCQPSKALSNRGLLKREAKLSLEANRCTIETPWISQLNSPNIFLKGRHATKI